MLYTIMPYETVYPQEIAAPEYVQKDGVIAEMRMGAYGTRQLCRIHTTELSRYLSDEYKRI